MSDSKRDPYTFTSGPIPTPDGAADLVVGRAIPDLQLPCDDGKWRSIADVCSGRAVVYVYPATGIPGKDPVAGWDQIPGAAGCTVQSLSFREHFGAITALGWAIAGLSGQPSNEQQEFARRVDLPFHLMSDERLELHHLIGLPTFTAGGKSFYRRLAMLIHSGHIVAVDYPIYPPQSSATRVLTLLQSLSFSE